MLLRCECCKSVVLGMSLLQKPLSRRVFRKRFTQYSAAGPRLGGRTCPRQSQRASQLLNFPSRALRPPLRQHPCLSIRSAHTHPPLARGGRVVCLLCSPSRRKTTDVRRRSSSVVPSDFFQLKALVLLVGLALYSSRLTYSSKHRRVALQMFQILHLNI